ncbi:hypothetical protein ERO13_A02G107000v2 [Gossypium hirsutum]|nr:hypothetical protein ERO13_A02G107000v2 [Gossypium hirsutum]
MRGKFIRKETDRAIFSATKGLVFEVHFKFVNEPHILLAQIAEKTAKKVYIQSFGKIDQCRVTDCSENQVFYYGEDPKQRKSPSGKANRPGLHTAGVDFGAFWKMEGHLDVRYRPMSRLGSIAECISPFSKMSFETASKFIVDAAKHGLVDNLETPSSRICLGLPVKMGTGSFGLMQKVEI